ncbi:hypothetical protein MEG1DRAFT_01987 [Photorhabdus temperata subsp. temperata Meg1]|uniref:Transcriptional regulator n=1 Tax=Photorhabdus temperata subsp. temperata Meg1 TaxID=1393735 RepID=A0A081RXA6_PHOTE|nr:hypothetical protein MEG1DRAFT_01987 [Photorhabdus temperata subsp. temperata Meg1]
MLIDTREQETRINYKQAMNGTTNLQERVEHLVAIRCREGYMAQWSHTENGAILLIENHCPICAAAKVCQGFCRAELNVFQDILQAQVERVEYMLTDSRRCTYRITSNIHPE